MISERMRQKRIERVMELLGRVRATRAQMTSTEPLALLGDRTRYIHRNNGVYALCDDIERILAGGCMPDECQQGGKDGQCFFTGSGPVGGCFRALNPTYDTGTALGEQDLVEAMGRWGFASSSAGPIEGGRRRHTFTFIEKI